MASFLIRLPDHELAALRDAADTYGRSMNDLACQAIRNALDSHDDENTLAIAQRIIDRDAELLRRLADA